MTSKPAVQKVTAAVSQRMRGSSEPRTAIHAAAGAMPRLKPQHQVRERGEPLGEGIEEDHGQRHRRQAQAQAVQLAGGEHEQRPKPPPRTPRRSRWPSRPAGRWRILVRGLRRVDIGVHQPVERHGRRARAHHGHDDPEAACRGRSPPAVAALAQGQQRAGQGERQGEDGVLELDHFERQAEAFPDHLERIPILPPGRTFDSWSDGARQGRGPQLETLSGSADSRG